MGTGNGEKRRYRLNRTEAYICQEWVNAHWEEITKMTRADVAAQFANLIEWPADSINRKHVDGVFKSMRKEFPGISKKTPGGRRKLRTSQQLAIALLNLTHRFDAAGIRFLDPVSLGDRSHDVANLKRIAGLLPLE